MLLTLAPEAVTPRQVAEIVALGVTVSLGHTNATAAEAEALLVEGATLFTHLFNAMSQMENRAPGVVGAAINSHAYCSIIADGLHVDPAMLGLSCRARPSPDHMILITDAMPTVGVSMQDALRMATRNPATLMGLEGQISKFIGAEISDLIVMNDAGSISALSCAIK